MDRMLALLFKFLQTKVIKGLKDWFCFWCGVWVLGNPSAGNARSVVSISVGNFPKHSLVSVSKKKMPPSVVLRARMVIFVHPQTRGAKVQGSSPSSNGNNRKT